MVSIETIINKQTYQNIHFPGKMPICKDQQIDYFLLINNVPDFEKMPTAFLNNNNLLLNINILIELHGKSIPSCKHNCAGKCSL